MPRVIHFEIHADDPERAVKFYQKVFGWEIQKWGGPVDYWLIKTGEPKEPGIDGAITREEAYNTIGVPSVDEFARKIVEAGGKVVREKAPIPGVGYLAYCMDTEGNVFGIMQEDPSAK